MLPVRASSLAQILVASAYARLGEDALADPAVGLLQTMLDRNFALVDAAIVAFATACGATAEVISRVSVESSVNIAFIAAGDAAERTQAYFDHYFSEVDRQVRTWSDRIDGLEGAAAEMHRKAVERRKSTNNALRNLIGGSMSQGKERWPKSIEQRFKELGDALGYRTVYARMSSEVHTDAEDTLRYLLGKLQGPDVFEAMALETVWTTRLYVHYAVSWYLRASIAYALRYGMHEVAELLKKELAVVEAELAEISLHVGSGLEDESP
jgi:hypothetical protein